MAMNKLFDGVLAVLVVLVMSGLLVWVIISIADGIAEDEDSYSFTSTHQGHYKDGKREGKWSINNNYRLDNGNDGRDEIEGSYVQGLRDGKWKVKTPYKRCIYEYNKGVIRKEICINNYYTFTHKIFNEWGDMIVKKEGSREKCKVLYSYFEKLYSDFENVESIYGLDECS
jgi:hypothetical protein